MLSSSSNFHRVYTYMYLLYVHGRTYVHNAQTRELDYPGTRGDQTHDLSPFLSTLRRRSESYTYQTSMSHRRLIKAIDMLLIIYCSSDRNNGVF